MEDAGRRGRDSFHSHGVNPSPTTSPTGSPAPLVGALEAGGTKFVVAAGTGPDDLRDVTRIETTTPDETLAKVIDAFLEIERRHGPLAAIGVGTFGPAGVHPDSPDYGWITTTPKPGWGNTDLRGRLVREFNVPVGFDTDVNAAAFGEWLWGAGKGCSAVLYLTVGTGIGGGFVLNGSPVHGLLHPEMGHIRLPRPPGEETPGVCPWHDNCLEGLASGPAIARRWDANPRELPPGHEAWELEAGYLATACAGFLCTLSPQRLILGGGVMEQTHLFPRIREKTAALLNGYLKHPEIDAGLTSLIVPPGLGSRAGILGALALGRNALHP